MEHREKSADERPSCDPEMQTTQMTPFTSRKGEFDMIGFKQESSEKFHRNNNEEEKEMSPVNENSVGEEREFRRGMYYDKQLS